MDFNFDLFIDILWLGTLCGIISMICVKKLKLTFKLLNSQIASMFVNFLIGFFVSILFTNLSIINSIVVGVITWIGAETILEKINKNEITNTSPNNLKRKKN